MIISEKLYLNLRRDGIMSADDEDFIKGGISRMTDGDITVLSVNTQIEQIPYIYARMLHAYKGAYADVTIDGEIGGVLSRKQFNPFWSEPCFENDLSELPDNIQNMLLEINGKYLAVLPIIGDKFNTTLMKSDSKNTLRFCLSPCCDGVCELDGVFAVLAMSENPYEAVGKAYRYACIKDFIKTRLREGKSIEPMYQKLGWCTWDAFYHDVSEEKIFEKLEEFKQKNIPIKWVIIDDGWMQVSDKERFALMSFKEDRNKFPNGLKSCVSKMKQDYGIEKVGVWHALTGYWFGVEKDSELFYEQRDNLREASTGVYIPDGEKAYDFFCSWYGYLKSQGIDFVKIDTQGNGLEFSMGQQDCMEFVRNLQRATDKAVYDCFDGNVVNCMGMNNINVYNRPYTALSRNSDDFYPNKPESFISHIMQNAYNAVFHSNLFYCDYDMWHSYGVTAKNSSVLRAISGGPIYMSDAVGKTTDEYIKPMLDNNGDLILCDDCALPTAEHLFKNPQNDVLKLINRKGDGYVMAVFNLSKERKKITVSLDEFEKNYVAYCYFGKKFYTDLPLVIELDGADSEIINFYPVNDGNICVGDLDKYISAGGENVLAINSL